MANHRHGFHQYSIFLRLERMDSSSVAPICFKRQAHGDDDRRLKKRGDENPEELFSLHRTPNTRRSFTAAASPSHHDVSLPSAALSVGVSPVRTVSIRGRWRGLRLTGLQRSCHRDRLCLVHVKGPRVHLRRAKQTNHASAAGCVSPVVVGGCRVDVGDWGRYTDEPCFHVAGNS